jgi:hypothetical protein
MDNAHVTRGGEVEKRKAFKLVGNVGIETYGLEGCGNTVYVFGSAATATVPQGITYQRLIHPDGPSFSMTKVVSFTSYAGKPFVIAEFNDGARYCYYDGQVVEDSVNGIFRISHGDVEGFLNHIKTLLPDGYSATVNPSGMVITGPQGTEFTVNPFTSGKFVAGTPLNTQQAVKPIPEVLAKGSFIISSGTAGNATVSSGWLRYIDGGSLPDITGIYVDGEEILGLTGGNGVRWDDIPQGGGWNLGPRFALTLSTLINANTSNSGYSASYAIQNMDGADRAYFTIIAKNATGSSANGKKVEIEFRTHPQGISGLSELIQTNTTAASQYNPDTTYHTATLAGDQGGLLAGGVDNVVSSVKVDGVEILGSDVHWFTSNSATAQAVADRINSYQSNPEYVASVIDGGKVILTASASTGSSPNGRLIAAATSGTALVSGVVPMGGGVDPVGGVSQKTVVGLLTTGTAAETVGSTFRMTIIDKERTTYPMYVGATAMGGLKLNYCFTYGSKVHILADSYVIGSAIDSPKYWKTDGVGVFFIDLSNNTNGTEDLVAAAPYQGKLAIFSRSSCQIWNIDVDPQNNAISQVVLNTGTVAPGSVISYGEMDVFYLSDSGIRSLRARDSSSQAQVADIGVNIDTIVSEKLTGVLPDTIFNTTCSVIEPRDNRLIMNIYDKMFVLSNYPTAGIQAWSTYTPEILPVKLMTIGGRMYARYGNSIYVYGGMSGIEYDGSTASMTLPYLDGTKPAHQKHLEGIDLTSDGSWDFYVGTDPYRPEVRDHIGIIDNSTFQLGRVIAVGIGTHIGVRLTSRGQTYGRIGNLILHYQINDAD